MCDTLIATSSATTDAVAVFAKNSDRPPNEGQHLAYVPAATHAAGTSLQCTYVEIPQAAATHAVLLSKPFWMWGAEMGVNEHGLAIGNEAVFSTTPANRRPALLGMDLLRAALERAVTPREAVQVIVDLLDAFGQGGNCTRGDEFYYHNSFVIVNAYDAWVLETIDKQWVAKQVTDFYSISNCLTITKTWDLASPDLIARAARKRFLAPTRRFDFARDYSDFLFTRFGRGRRRRATTFNALDAHQGQVSVDSMMRLLRHHDHEDFDPQAGLTTVDVCMHAGFGPIRTSQSTASMVVYLDTPAPLVFATATSAPCTSIFKPIWLDTASALDLGPAPTERADSSLYWTHEKLHRATLLNYPQRLSAYAPDRDTMESAFTRAALAMRHASAPERAAFTNRCFAESRAAEAEWLTRVEAIPAKQKRLHARAWHGFNEKAGMAPALR